LGSIKFGYISAVGLWVRNRIVVGNLHLVRQKFSVDRNLSSLISAGGPCDLTAGSDPRRLIAASNNLVVTGNLLADNPRGNPQNPAVASNP